MLSLSCVREDYSSFNYFRLANEPIQKVRSLYLATFERNDNPSVNVLLGNSVLRFSYKNTSLATVEKFSIYIFTYVTELSKFDLI